MIYVLSGGVTNVAGVIHVSYPANSTLVVKGTSSGKQFAKDTNTTSSAKAYIFLTPIGNASYTLTATNTAGETVSKNVYVAKDQVQSVVLAYFSATISITYPAASTCVVTDSSGTQIASDTNGGSSAKTWTATVGATGTYTITATSTDGSKTKSTSVSITAAGQIESVTLGYALVLFDGTDNTVVTGGLKLQRGNSATSGSTSAAPITGGKITWRASGYAGLYSSSKVDITDYSTLVVDITIGANPGFNYISRVGIISPSVTPSKVMEYGAGAGSYFAAYQELSAGTTQLRIDVSSISGERQFMLMYYANNDASVSIDNIYFE